MIGIIIADLNEINNFPFEIQEIKKINQFHFTIYKNKIVVVHSGIGIANAASATQELISSFQITEIINYGSVGGNNQVNLYDVITPKKILFHDVVTPWKQRGQTPGELGYFLNHISSNKNNNLASGSSFIADKKICQEIKVELNCDIFDMEAAAIAQIAHKNNIPLKVIKCVSDCIGITNKDSITINKQIIQAGKIAFDKVVELIRAIK